MDLTQLQQQAQAVDPVVWLVAAGVVAIVVLAAVLLLVRRARRRRSLRRRYGAQYDHTVEQAGSRRRADQQLVEREDARHRYEVRELRAGERDRLRARWEALQASFVDDPWAAVRGSDELIAEVAATKGYPTDGDDPLAGVSVDHPRTLDHYRSAGQRIEKAGGAEAGTEELRQAMLTARDLFETLVGSTQAEGAPARSAFRALVDDEQAPQDGPVGQPAGSEASARSHHAEPDGEPTTTMPLYGPDGRPLWEDEHVEHGR